MTLMGDDDGRFWLKVRIGLIAVVFVGSYFAVVGRVYYLQTVEAEALQERTAVQRDREVVRQARRGDIRDRNGVEMAVSVEVSSIFVRPGLIANPAREAQRLAPHLRQSAEELEEILTSDRRFVWLKRQAPPSVAEAIEALDIYGVELTTEYKRYYPLGPVGGQLVGFVGIDGDGLEGLERRFHRELAGDTYSMSISRDARGRPMLLSDTPEFGQFEGHSVHLTIDEKIQRVAEEALMEQVLENEAIGGYAVVVDVRTGDILAMANTPRFDPNRLNDHTSGDWRLRGVTDTIEPGSVFKPFLVAAALNENTTTLDRVYDTKNGRMRVGGYTIGDVTRRPEMTTAEIIQRSSNIGSYKIAREMGRQTYYDYVRAFGFGQATGIDLRGEQPGVVWPPDRWAEITFANVAFGQGLTATPLQLAMATAALANDGVLMRPRIIDEIRDRQGQTVHREEPTMVRRVISPEAARQTSWAMSLVTVPGGTGTAGALEHFTVAAKTGTAQKVNPETRRYDPDLWVSGFVGYAPAERPEVAIVVFIDEPQVARYGGVVAGPAFAKIATEALARRGTLPLPPEERFQLGDTPPRAVEVAVAPPAPEHVVVLPTMRVFREPAAVDGTTGLPDFRNMTLRQALTRSRNLGIVPQTNGWGRVIDQSPPPGTVLGDRDSLVLTLAPRTQHSFLAEEPSQGEAIGED